MVIPEASIDPAQHMSNDQEKWYCGWEAEFKQCWRSKDLGPKAMKQWTRTYHEPIWAEADDLDPIVFHWVDGCTYANPNFRVADLKECLRNQICS